MARTPVTVIAPAGLADGYRLAGVRAEQAETAAEAGAVLDRLLGEDARPSVIAVHPRLAPDLGSRRQRRIAGLEDVLMVTLPQGAVSGEPASGAESLRDLLARAVGYEFTFEPR
jgi:vacuolar-type H+-ATPase subunit F/Vma7